MNKDKSSNQCKCDKNKLKKWCLLGGGIAVIVVGLLIVIIVNMHKLMAVERSDVSKLLGRIGDLQQEVDKLKSGNSSNGGVENADSNNSDGASTGTTAKQKLQATLDEAKRRLTNASNNVKQTDGYHDLQAGVEVVSNKLKQADTTISENSQTYVKLKDMLDALVTGLKE